MRIAAGDVMRALDETVDSIAQMATALIKTTAPTTVLRTVPLPASRGSWRLIPPRMRGTGTARSAVEGVRQSIKRRIRRNSARARARRSATGPRGRRARPARRPVDGGVAGRVRPRAGVLDEPRVGGAAAGRKLRPPSGHVLNRRGDQIGERPRAGEKRDRVDRLEGERRARASGRRRDPPRNLRLEQFGRPEIVEADVEGEPDLGGMTFARHCRHRRWSLRGSKARSRGALVERRREQRGQHRR